MSTRHLHPSLVAVTFLLLAVLGLGGCEAIFTYTPLAGLQRPPSSLSAAEKLTYAQNALASGDKNAMLEAYDAIQNDSSPEAQYLAAQLGIEISGVPEFILKVASGAVSLPASGDPSVITSFITDTAGVDPDYLIAAAAILSQTSAADLTTMDYVYGGLGMALDAAQQPDGTYDFTNIPPDKQSELSDAKAFVQEAVTAMSPDDPAYSFLSSYNTYMQAI
ncbi:MAG: hypothetical protein ABSF77_01580 [Spirochaetia bacterium]